ncbi:hypothetical protein [Gemmobacter serpentinus]|uniref:hypothetical protein n=1 Tax=Gemmobacter serpentinus TaxID=2652247 RepID=UPI001865811E|nr:hypothetical protein [Gemmobacter serpentinus]
MRKPDPEEELMALRALLRRLRAADTEGDSIDDDTEVRPLLTSRPGCPIRRLVPRLLH